MQNIAQTTGQFVSRAASLEFWLYGLLSGFIGGGATATMSTVGLTVAHASGMNVPTLNLKAIGIVYLSAGLTTALGYLSKSPLPPLVTVTETTQTITQTAKTTVETKTVPEAPAEPQKPV